MKGPKALCELQGYVYDAWLRMADIYDALGRKAKASRLRRKAADLYERFNDVFWDEESGFYAFALDGEKAKVMSVASNPGHCLRNSQPGDPCDDTCHGNLYCASGICHTLPRLTE